MLYVLQSRAWACHLAFTIFGLFLTLFPKGSAYSDPVQCGESIQEDCVKDYNKELMDPIEPVFKIMLSLTVIVGAILNALCFKWRWMANMLIYHDCLLRIVISFKLNHVSYSQSNIQYAMFFGINFVCLYCDEGRQIIAMVATLAWHLFITNYVGYSRELTTISFVVSVAYVIVFLLCLTLAGMVIIHFSSLHRELLFTNEENVKLLNGMHEGVLIIENSDTAKNVFFCNRPALKMISTF